MWYDSKIDTAAPPAASPPASLSPQDIQRHAAHGRVSVARSGQVRLLFAGLALGAAVACSSAPDPEDPTAAGFSVPPTQAAPPPTVRPSQPPPPPPSKVVEIKASSGEEEQRTLVQAAEAERQRRRQLGEESTIVINNQNLADYAKDGQLTYVEEVAGTSAAATSGETAGAAAERDRRQDEDYWRGRAIDIRLKWRRAVEDSDVLKDRIARLRQDFYREDDPYIRDGQIKPQWDKALVDLEQARDDARRYQVELDTLFQEAQDLGIELVWLQEGVDLEPEGTTNTGARGDDDQRLRSENPERYEPPR